MITARPAVLRATDRIQTTFKTRAVRDAHTLTGFTGLMITARPAVLRATDRIQTTFHARTIRGTDTLTGFTRLMFSAPPAVLSATNGIQTTFHARAVRDTGHILIFDISNIVFHSHVRLTVTHNITSHDDIFCCTGIQSGVTDDTVRHFDNVRHCGTVSTTPQDRAPN